MRKITQQSVKNFIDGVPFKRSNMEVSREGTICYLKLHGNKIAARLEDGRMWISNAGWDTPTTKERLNGLPGVNIIQRNWKWILNGMQWDGTPIFINTI
jgi:hypothetical protein